MGSRSSDPSFKVGPDRPSAVRTAGVAFAWTVGLLIVGTVLLTVVAGPEAAGGAIAVLILLVVILVPLLVAPVVFSQRRQWQHATDIGFGSEHLVFRRRFGRTAKLPKSKVRDVFVSPRDSAPSRLTVVRKGRRKLPLSVPLHGDWSDLTEFLAVTGCVPYTGVKERSRFNIAKHTDRDRFEAFLSDRSDVEVTDIDGIEKWLREEPVYLSDGDIDHWHMPSEFERLLAGDCDDHAVWAWTKLHHLGYEPELVLGWMNVGPNAGFHAWVRFIDDGQLINAECTAKSPSSKMFEPWSDVRKRYDPVVVVTAGLECFRYPGQGGGIKPGPGQGDGGMDDEVPLSPEGD